MAGLAHGGTTMSARSARERGFTLIEMLVVISIIAILASILFPVFAAARERARSVACLSNQKQISMAITMYCQDLDEQYPPAVDPASGAWWEMVVQPYIKSGQVGGILSCASASSRAYAYSMNWAVSGKREAAIGNPADTILTADGAQAPRFANATDRLAQAAPYFLYTYPGWGEALWTV